MLLGRLAVFVRRRSVGLRFVVLALRVVMGGLVMVVGGGLVGGGGILMMLVGRMAGLSHFLITPLLCNDNA